MTQDENVDRWREIAEAHARTETGLLITGSNKHLFSDADFERWRLAKVAYIERALAGVTAMIELQKELLP